MKKNLLYWLLALVTLGFVGCSDDDDDCDAPNGISVEWAANPDFDTVEIKTDMNAVINIKAEDGIKALELDIKSAALTNEILGMVGLSTHVDLVNVELSAYAAILGGLPYGDKVKDQKEVVFDVSKLVPMIIILPGAPGDHVFTVKVTDNKGRSESRDLVFHYTEPADLSASEINLWNNTALITAKGLSEDALVQYREQGTDEWQTVEGNGNGGYPIKPVWEEKTNEAGLTVYAPKANTGVWAGKTYEFRIMEGDNETFTGTFDTEKGDVIPNGDMSGWSKTKREGLGSPADVPYPNAEGDTLWDCGNNGVTKDLCASTEELYGKDAPAALLKSKNMFVLAAGNLFTGNFDYASFTGTATFGEKYTYTARPKALKFNYDAIVGKVDVVRSSGDVVEGVAKDDPDKARIFVAIVDWSAPHSVVSGMTDTKNPWSPENGADVVTEGKIIGYGSFVIDETDAAKTALEMPLKEKEIEILWYDTTAAPQKDNVSLVISCACNYYGDFFTGCSKNQMVVDDFEWVY